LFILLISFWPVFILNIISVLIFIYFQFIVLLNLWAYVVFVQVAIVTF